MLRERTRVSDYSFIRWWMDQKCFIKSVAFDNEQDFKKTGKRLLEAKNSMTMEEKEKHGLCSGMCIPSLLVIHKWESRGRLGSRCRQETIGQTSIYEFALNSLSIKSKILSIFIVYWCNKSCNFAKVFLPSQRMFEKLGWLQG